MYLHFYRLIKKLLQLMVSSPEALRHIRTRTSFPQLFPNYMEVNFLLIDLRKLKIMYYFLVLATKL